MPNRAWPKSIHCTAKKPVAPVYSRSLIASLCLTILVCAVYSNAWNGPFVFDDYHVIPENPSIQSVSNIPTFFTDITHFSVLPGNRDYRPVFLTAMSVAWWLGDGETWPFHVFSIALHSANTVFLYLIARILLLNEAGAKSGHSARREDKTAFVAAALFAVHPLATESVNYISSQSVPLAACFYLLAFLLFVAVSLQRSESGIGRRGMWLAISSISYALALLSKPIAITLPVVLILFDLIFGDRLLGNGKIRWRDLGRRFWMHVPFWVISALYLVVRRYVSASNTSLDGGDAPRSMMVHYLTETHALVFYYLRLCVWPFGQSVDREYRLVSSVLEPGFLLAALFLCLAIGMLVMFRRQKNLVFWALWFPVCLSVTTYAVILRQIVNEHRVYLSLAGICVLAAYLGYRIVSELPTTISDLKIGRRSGGYLAGFVVILVIVGLSFQTFKRNETWSSRLSLWEEAVSNEGTWRAHMNYGLALEDAGRQNEALAQFEEAVRRGPYAFAYLNLGNAQMRRGMHDRGLSNLREAVRLWPSSPETRLFLALGLSRLGEYEEAELEFRQALAIRPNYLLAYRQLAEFYERTDRIDEAITVLRQLQKLVPDQQWISERIRLTQSAEIDNQGTSDSLFQTSFEHQQAGRLSQAIEGYEAFLRRSPSHVQATFNLAYAYLQDGLNQNLGRSDVLFERVLLLDSEYTEAIYHIASVNWKAGNKQRAAEYDRLYLEVGSHPQLRERAEQRLSE